MQNKKILLTGGTGFIGKNILKLLGGKYEIFSPSRKELNISDQQSVDNYLSDKKFDIVIHCAIPTPWRNDIDKDTDILDYTMRGLFNLKFHEKEFEKIIYVGSGAEFDKSEDIVDAKETDIGKRIPKDAYGYAKYILNQIANSSCNIYNLRIFGCYGEEEHEFRLIRSLVEEYLTKSTMTIRQDCVFSYVLVDDLICIMDWVINNNPKYHEYNVCNPKKYKLSELAKIIAIQLNAKVETVIKKDGFNKEYSGNCSRLLNELKDFEFTPIEDGIKQEIKWLKNKQV